MPLRNIFNRKPAASHLLCKAVKNNDVETVKKLLQQGADVNAKNNNGKTARGLAMQDGRAEIADILEQAAAASEKTSVNPSVPEEDPANADALITAIAETVVDLQKEVQSLRLEITKLKSTPKQRRGAAQKSLSATARIQEEINTL